MAGRKRKNGPIRKAIQAVQGGVEATKKIKSLQDIANFSRGANDLLALKDKPFSDVVLEAIGVRNPIPSADEAIAFAEELIAYYGNLDEDLQFLLYLDPKDWTENQFLKYTAAVKKFNAIKRIASVINPVIDDANEKKARAIRRVKKEINDEKKRFNFLIKLYNEFISDVNKNLKEDTPEDLKAKGIQSFPQLFSVLLKQTAKTFFSSLANSYKTLGLDKLGQLEKQIKEDLGINDLSEASPEELKARFCPTQETLDQIIIQRNNMVEYLNNQQDRLNNLKKPIEGTGVVVDFLQQTSTRIKLVAFIANQAAKIIPLIPGAVVSIINDLETIRQTILVTNKNEPRIPKFQGAISNVMIPLNQFSRLITQIVFKLSEIDEIIALCRPDAELNSLSPEVLATVAIQLSADLDAEDSNLYKGFRLEIETRKYTDTVNQNRAVGKNQSGIILINTDWSFASDPSVLIRELKFRIDAENLETY